MAKIQTLKNKDDVIIYPQTHGTAVFVNEGELLQDKIEQYLTSEEVGEVENVDITAELTSNKVTSIRDTSTDLQYPSAKAVYDFVSNTETGVKIEIYANKEAVSAPNSSTIYLIGAAAPYEEYLYLEDTATWELIGNASVDLSDYALKTEIPTKTSELENDSGYLTEIPAEYITETELNNKGYLVEESLSDLALKSEIPTNLSQLNNDKGYVNSAADSPNLVKYIWLGTQEEYDTLTSLDSNTEYNIIEEE